MVKFVKAGKIERAYKALRIVIDDPAVTRGDLIVGASAVQELLAGRRVVEISRVETHGEEADITYGGVARISMTGRAVVWHVCGGRYSTPLAQVKQVVSGARQAAVVSKVVEEIAPIIDTDEVQMGERRIDEGLEKTF